MSSSRSSEEKGEPHVRRWPLDQWRPLLDLIERGPARYPDGTRDETTDALDTVSDMLAAPSCEDDAA